MLGSGPFPQLLPWKLAWEHTVTGAGVQTANVQRAGLARDGRRHRLVRIILVLWQKHVQRRGRHNLARPLGILKEEKERERKAERERVE